MFPAVFFFLFLYRKKTFCPQANLRTFSVIFFGGAVAEHFSDFSYNVQILFSGLFFFPNKQNRSSVNARHTVKHETSIFVSFGVKGFKSVS